MSVDWLDVMIILDVSKSMLAEDIQDSSWEYSRISTAKSLLWNIVTQNPENRYGLVIFAWEAVNVSPLTSDPQIFLNFLSWVDYRNINEQWTDLVAAYTLGLERFIDDENNWKAVVLVSDWWDEDDSIDTKTIQKLLRDSWTTQTVMGIWTIEWGKIARWRDIFWVTNYEQFNGKDVITKLNKKGLESISNLEWWEYYEISALDDIDTISSIFADIEKKSIEKAWWKNTLDITRYIAFFVFLIFIYFLMIPIISKKRN